ncbi:CRISPR-associated endonuclease Cas1 [Nitrosopumilus sp.]|uniref:CRISPR-associated endonuclease Cas1 n=1 Tax=Nitrosopumilus sp. TaxID=2024843 RepID=UPI0034A01D01
MIIEILTHGSTLKRNHDSFVIQNKEEKSEIPAEKVDAIIISSNSLISTQAVRLCIEKQIQLVISTWSGKPIARMWSSSPGKSTELRRNQYLNQDTVIGYEISMNILSKKLSGQKRLLLDLKNNRKLPPVKLEAAILTINNSLKNLDAIEYTNGYKATFLGLEGACAANYFQAIFSILPKKWSTAKRSQHPAHDAFNATLNYLYGMAYSDVEKIIILSGLDPNAGFYHSDSYGKPTLSFDIIEIIRPVVDRIIVTAFTKKMVNDNWFEKQDDVTNGIFLSKEGRKFLISSYVENGRKTIETTSWDFCKIIIEKLVTRI